MKKSLFICCLSLIICICGCDLGNEESPCNDDQNGLVNDNCVRVVVNPGNYLVQGNTYEYMRLSFIRGAETVHVNLTDEDSLIGEQTYNLSDTEASLGFAVSSGPITSVNDMQVVITEVERNVDGNRISGRFRFSGTSESNFQSFELSREGSFTEVSF